MLDFMKDLFSNYCLMAAVCSWLMAQFLKICTGLYKVRKFNLKALLFGTGGMPSSHMASVCGLCISCIIKNGIGDVSVAITGVLCAIVCIDATGVRRETGKQSVVINKLVADESMESQWKKEAAAPLTKKEIKIEKKSHLEEFVGHTPLQVFFGAVTGFLVAFLMQFIPFFQI